MKNLDAKDIKEKAKHILGADNYKTKFDILYDDVSFFNEFMKRNKKSDFCFEVRINSGSYNRLFNKLYERYGRMTSNLENVFAEFTVLSALINDVYTRANEFSKEEKQDIIYYFERYQDFDLNSIVCDVVNCSFGCDTTIKALNELREGINYEKSNL